MSLNIELFYIISRKLSLCGFFGPPCIFYIHKLPFYSENNESIAVLGYTIRHLKPNAYKYFWG